jgi:hypothetical protein
VKTSKCKKFYNIFHCRLLINQLLIWDTTSKNHYPVLITLLNAVMNVQIPLTMDNILTRWETISSSKWILVHVVSCVPIRSTLVFCLNTSKNHCHQLLLYHTYGPLHVNNQLSDSFQHHSHATLVSFSELYDFSVKLYFFVGKVTNFRTWSGWWLKIKNIVKCN